MSKTQIYIYLFIYLFFFFCYNFSIRAQLFETKDVISERIVKTLIIKYGIYANIFAEKCE